jgi:hypothetical protein
VGCRWYTLSSNGVAGDGVWMDRAVEKPEDPLPIAYFLCSRNFKSVVSTKKYGIRAWFKYICRNSLAWMPRK